MFSKSWQLMDNEGGSGGAGGGGGGSPAAGGSPSPAAGDGAGAKPWYDGFQDNSVKEWLTNYKDAYPSAEAVALKALNLERFMGAEKAGRGVIMPKADAKPEEWTSFWKKTGLVPEKADAYKLPDSVKDDPGLIKFRDYAHSVGIPTPIFNKINEFLVKEASTQAQTLINEFDLQAGREMQEIDTEWGPDRDKNMELSQRAAAMFLPHTDKDDLEEILSQMEGVLGTKNMMNFWLNIGKATSEHGFVGGDQMAGGGAMSPEAARNRINMLKNDKDFGAKLLAKDADTIVEWNNLHKIGYGHTA